jgi:mono/diheme cytochrome c family protein
LRTEHTGVKTRRRLSRAAAVCLLAAAVAGCRQDMHDAPRYDPLEASTLLPGGASAQPLVDGTVPRGYLRLDELRYTGKVGGADADLFPFEITRADLDIGQTRFETYCMPCHGPNGEGNGMVVQRGYRRPASFHIDRLREAPAGQIFDRITNGFGVMPSYRSQIDVDDRWRIVAYVRVLQAARQGTRADVPAEMLAALDNPTPSGAEAGGAQ